FRNFPVAPVFALFAGKKYWLIAVSFSRNPLFNSSMTFGFPFMAGSMPNSHATEKNLSVPLHIFLQPEFEPPQTRFIPPPAHKKKHRGGQARGQGNDKSGAP